MERIRKGDLVQVIAGKEKGRVVIERLQMVKRHTKPSQKNQQGGIVEKEGSVHLSNVMPIDPQTDKPTRVRIISKDGAKQRIAKSGAVIEAQS